MLTTTIEVGIQTLPGERPVVQIGVQEARGTLGGQPLYLQVAPLSLNAEDLRGLISGLVKTHHELTRLESDLLLAAAAEVDSVIEGA